jgi:Zn-dependent peptidase ImmA (M78 family)
MRTAVIDRIETDAEETLRQVFSDINILRLPVNINEILNYYNLTLQRVQFEDSEVSGTFDRPDSRISINAEDRPWRQAFTAAHELGHYKLHADAETETFYRMDMPKVDGVSQLDPKEQEANWFAASILMPRTLLINFWSLTKDIEKLADIFGVSPSAMRYRLKNLKLI